MDEYTSAEWDRIEGEWEEAKQATSAHWDAPHTMDDRVWLDRLRELEEAERKAGEAFHRLAASVTRRL